MKKKVTCLVAAVIATIGVNVVAYADITTPPLQPKGYSISLPPTFGESVDETNTGGGEESTDVETEICTNGN